MAARGDNAAARQLAKTLRGLARKVDSGEMMRVLAEQSRELVDDGFARGTDPHGKPWAPLAVRDGQPLRDTRRLQASFTYVLRGGKSFEVGTNTKYAPTHQFGATIVPVRAKALRFMVGGAPVFKQRVVIPPRPMLPLTGLPRRWAVSLEHAARDFVRGEFA